MKRVLAIGLILVLASAAGARDISEAYVSLSSPAAVSPGQSYTFMFWVQNNSPDSEWITDVAITFPDGFTLDAGSIGYTPILEHPLHPSWDMYVDGQTAWWVDNNGGYGELWDVEGTDLWIDAIVPEAPFDPLICWELFGDGWGSEPHYVSDCIDLGTSPVDELTWTSIKAIFK